MNALKAIQAELKAPKNQHNNFGNYNYRSAEDILEAVKPLLAEHGAVMTISDEIVMIGTRFYVKATCTFTDSDNATVAVTAFAREPESKKASDESQITGAASSYARKYALNGLFLIDDAKDADSNEYYSRTRNEPPPRQQTPPQNQQSNQPSTSQQQQVIADLITQTNTKLTDMLGYYKVQTIEQLSAQAADHAIKSLRSKLNA